MEIEFSGAEIALIAALLSAITTPLLVLFRMLIAEKTRQIERLERQNEQLIEGWLSGQKSVEHTTQELKQRERR